MDIAFYHCHLPTAGRKPGGVEVFVDRLGEALVGRGHRVTAFTYAPPSDPRAYEVRRLRPASGATSTVVRQYLAPWLFNVRPFGDRFDVLHLHGDDWFYFRRRLPTVRTFYGSAIFEAATATSWKRRINSSVTFGLELLAARRADAVYGIGTDSRALFGADGVLSYGVDRPVPGTRSARPVILFVGTWEGRKRGRMLRDVFVQHVRPHVPDAELWMVCDHVDEEPGVVWFDGPSDAELQDLYRQAWTFCLPSAYEGLGLPYIEAMAHGLPVVATPNPGSVEVLAGGRYGLLVEVAELGMALVRTLTDDRIRADLVARSGERAQAFLWPALLDQYEAAYALAVDRFRATRR